MSGAIRVNSYYRKICRNPDGVIRLCCQSCTKYGPITLVSIPCYGEMTWDLRPYQMQGLLGGCQSYRRWRIINLSTSMALAFGMIDCDGTLVNLPDTLAADCSQWYSSMYGRWSEPRNQRLALQHYCL